MKIVVVGGTGRIGRSVVRRLLAQGRRAISWRPSALPASVTISR